MSHNLQKWRSSLGASWQPEHTLVFTVALVKMAVLFSYATWFQGSAWLGHMLVDIWGWLEFYKRTAVGQIPYVDFHKEYPVSMGYFYWLMGALISRRHLVESLVTVHAVVMSVVDVVNSYLFYRILLQLKVRRALFYALLFSLNLTVLILSPLRHEAIVTLFLLLGLRHWVFIRTVPQLEVPGSSKNARALAFFWGLGATLKWYPGVYFFAQWLMWLRARRWQLSFVTALIAGAIFIGMQLPSIVGGWLQNGNVDQWWATYAFHIHRPLYWDTVIGVLTLFFGEISFERSLSLFSTLLMIGLAVFPLSMNVLKKGILTCIAALVFNRVYSTQFHLWFYPLLLLVIALDDDRRLARLWLWLFIALDVINVLIYPFSFAGVLDEIQSFGPFMALRSHGPWIWIFSSAIVVRAVLLVALGASLVFSHFREQRSAV